MAERAGGIKRSKHLPWMVVAFVLLVLGGAMAISALHLRKVIREKIIQQDGVKLYAASMVPASHSEDLPEEMANDAEFLFVDLSEKVLEASKRQDVIAVRIFDQNGNVQLGDDEGLSESELRRLRSFETISLFDPKARLRNSAGQLTDEKVPLIRALVPLQQEDRFLGAAEFVLDGRKVASDLANLDRDLWVYSGLIFAIGGGITATALAWSFGRLQRANKLLGERTHSLLRANHELMLSAKTSAIGAITAHLIHDLKSPLFGLQSFVSARGAAEDEDWDVALNTTHRMQKLIGEIVRILQEERITENYELTIEELLSLLSAKLEPQCTQAGLDFATECSISGSLVNRDGNVVLLLITNIVQNAIQATPKGGRISVTAASDNGQAVFEMGDSGPGLPDHIRATIFTPSRSTKTGGSGLGLAISKQLANHIGAELILKESSTSGTIFQLRIPERLLASDLALP